MKFCAANEHTAFHAERSVLSCGVALLPQHVVGGSVTEPAPFTAQVMSGLPVPRERTGHTAQFADGFGLQNSTERRAVFCGKIAIGEVPTIVG